MSGKSNFSFLALHVYIIMYLILIVISAPDHVMQVVHIICPFVVIPFLYYTIKMASYTTPAAASNKKKESYKAY